MITTPETSLKNEQLKDSWLDFQTSFYKCQADIYGKPVEGVWIDLKHG